MMATVDTRGLDRLLESWDALLREFPGKKRGFLEQLGPKLLELVNAGIGGSGKVQGWQGVHMGSGGGYVAVRPKAETYQATRSGTRYAVGYITNAIEGGHRHGGPRGSTKPDYHYRPRLNKAATPGKFFYRNARQGLASLTEGEIQALAGEIKAGLEGGL